mmetsp:Transcript_30075/g.36726  ORF Transcript_30075/g.36726 Transcript_30075/m.36726 type:complete len:160 (+) Transcript_30075:280-759(+)
MKWFIWFVGLMMGMEGIYKDAIRDLWRYDLEINDEAEDPRWRQRMGTGDALAESVTSSRVAKHDLQWYDGVTKGCENMAEMRGHLTTPLQKVQSGVVTLRSMDITPDLKTLTQTTKTPCSEVNPSHVLNSPQWQSREPWGTGIRSDGELGHKGNKRCTR